jgi:pimeloyl-ACP methyl ester carboxylesterase
MKAFARPVRIIFDDSDPYLKKGVARTFHKLFPISNLFFLPGVRHYVQVGDPRVVAQLILFVPIAEEVRF